MNKTVLKELVANVRSAVLYRNAAFVVGKGLSVMSEQLLSSIKHYAFSIFACNYFHGTIMGGTDCLMRCEIKNSTV